MGELKTMPGRARVGEFLAAVADPQKRRDCRKIGQMMRLATGRRAAMWGTSIVGYGSYQYTYASGHSGTSMETGYSPRARNIAVYIMPGFEPFAGQLARLGRHKTGKSCLYIRRLADVDEDVLAELIDESVKEMRRRYR